MELVKFLKSAFILLTILGIAVWMGMVWKAENEEELQEACHPIDWAMDGIHNVIAGLIGQEPRWTRMIQIRLVKGCEFFVWRVSQVDHVDGEGDENVGGVRLK